MRELEWAPQVSLLDGLRESYELDFLPKMVRTVPPGLLCLCTSYNVHCYFEDVDSIAMPMLPRRHSDTLRF
jgi:hypothetical protein